MPVLVADADASAVGAGEAGALARFDTALVAFDLLQLVDGLVDTALVGMGGFEGSAVRAAL